MSKTTRIGLIGAGKLGKAFLRGLQTETTGAPSVIASVRSPESLKSLQKEFPSIKSTLSNEEVVENSDCIFLGVKPQVAKDTLRPLQNLFRSAQHILSFCARLQLKDLQSLWAANAPHPTLHRLMANTAMERKLGLFGHTGESALPEELHKIISSTGLILEIEESRFDAFTTLSASAPAFILEFVKGLESFGTKEKLSQATVEQSLSQILLGVASLIQSGDTLDNRVNQIATKGGMTAEGLEVLRSHNLSQLVEKSCDSTLQKALTFKV